ncbi:hypothetical protein E5676_scaffold265G001310 [Cucumis melo var. makuwa]|uniref:Retrovirus-related Pol polyprotein from transposon TNT 1-94 n=1 Tax=Cucumis melo var. makuwa TaxID=1194695 RepID=A0A5A7TXL0_CUCMM|nr:hypothetical protein E6C27_scaffold63G001830 [Cucumis melo var. makuwa]TYK07994.1 hypothetical protein E5676_scaffold265G001310 [Cucumis melo var. makuwa]
MKDLGEADIILGVKIRKNKTSLSLYQSHYVEKILRKFESFDVSPVRTPFDASKHLKKNKGDSVSQPEYAKIIGTIDYCLHFNKFPAVLEGYCDANWVTDNDECDSQAAICTAKNSVYNGKSRHIRLRHAVVKQLLKEGTISLEFVRSEKNLADPLTKGLTRKMVLDSSVNMGLKPFGYP